MRSIILLFILLIFSIATFKRNIIWSSEIILWTDVTKKSPNKSRGWSNFGASLIEAGRGEEGARLIEKAIAMNPDEPIAYNNLASYYQAKKEYDKALAL